MNRHTWKIATCGVVLALVAAFIVYKNSTPGPKPDGQQRRVVRIGAIVPTTGPLAAIGNLIKRGLDAGVEDVNAKNQDIQIEIKFEDSKSNPKEGLTSFQKLVSVDGEKIVIVSASAICNAVAPEAESAKVLMLGTSTSMPGLVDNRKFVIRFFPNVDMLAGTIADYALSRYKRVAVLHSDDIYGKSTFTTFAQRFKGDGREIIFSEAFAPTQTDFATTVAKMLDTKPDAIYIPGYGPGYIALLNRIRERDKVVPILSDSPLTNPPIYHAAGEAAAGVIVPATPLDAGIAESDEQKAFLQAYQAKFKENPSINVTVHYDLVHVLVKALKSTDGSPEAVRQFLVKELGSYKGVVGEIVIDPSGESTVKVQPMRIEGGTIVPIAR